MYSYLKKKQLPTPFINCIAVVYERGSFNDIDKLPNEIIGDPITGAWTTWTEVLNSKSLFYKTNMNAKQEAINLIDEINNEANGDLDGYFDNGKKIALAILKKDYTIQQKTRIIDALKSLTLEEYEPR